MLDIWMFRHAECEMNKRYSEFVGGRSLDSPPTALGLRQSALLGRRLRDEQRIFERVYASPALRTVSTAHIACTEFGYPLEKIILTDKLLELSQGEWEGRPRAECYSAKNRAIIARDPWNFKPPGGQSQRESEEDGLELIESLLPYHQQGLRVAMFTHGMKTKCILRGVLGSSAAMTHKIVLDNASITRLQYSNEGFYLHSLNDAAHLR